MSVAFLLVWLAEPEEGIRVGGHPGGKEKGMYTLGINAVYHDSAACLVQDGQVIAAAEEERFAHVKHGKRPLPFSAYQLPYYAIDYCLSEAGIALADVEHVAYSFDPHLLLNNFSPNGTNSQPLEPGAHPIPACLLYTSPSPRDGLLSRMPSSA